jgi:tetratricopeptide (TPR) repeat protein
MASKINKKFTFVVAGFIGAAALLVAAAIVVNVTYIQNADRHIRAGDELMAQGKLREAFQMYGRAVNKKPNELRYIEKMEDALSKTVAQNAGQALEDYRSWVGLKRARTRAQPTDMAQWKMLLDSVEAESELYEQGNGWLNLETAAKEMKDAMPAGSPGVRLADETMLFARAQRERYLTPAERVDLDKALEAYLAQDPKSWRAWSALVDLRIADSGRLRDAGQEQASARRIEQLDAAMAKMGTSVDANDPSAQFALARAAFERGRFGAMIAARASRGKADMKGLAPLEAALAAAAPRTGSSRAVREAAGMLLDDGNSEAESALLDAWVKDHPDDLLAQAYRMELRARAGTQDPVSWETLRADAQALLDRPQLATSLMSNLQASLRARALQLLIDTTVERLVREPEGDAKAKLLASLAPLRAKLVESEQNDEASPRVIAADAKIALANNDITQAAAKWEQYFVKVPTPSADAFLWASTTARIRGDLGLALQRST